MIGGFVVGMVFGAWFGMTLMGALFVARDKVDENADLSKEVLEFSKKLEIMHRNEPVEEGNNHD